MNVISVCELWVTFPENSDRLLPNMKYTLKQKRVRLEVYKASTVSFIVFDIRWRVGIYHEKNNGHGRLIFDMCTLGLNYFKYGNFG